MNTFAIKHGEHSWQLFEFEEGVAGPVCIYNFKTEEQANQKLEELMALPKCLECGSPCDANYTEPSASEIKTRQLCFKCNVWTNRLPRLSDKDTAIIKGLMFHISEELPKDYRGFKGHGGAEFCIGFNDGRRVTTRNLWANGEIPDHFRARFPDNAEFVEKARTSAYIGSGAATQVR